MSQKIWNLKYVAGMPGMFARVTPCADNPMSRAEALSAAEKVANNGAGWCVWVERDDAGERIFESAAEKEHQAVQRSEGKLRGLLKYATPMAVIGWVLAHIVLVLSLVIGIVLGSFFVAALGCAFAYMMALPLRWELGSSVWFVLLKGTRPKRQ